MEHNDLFIFDTEEVDVKEMMKIRIPMVQNDTPILKFRVYNYGEPVDLSEYHYEFRGFLPNGELYSEEDNLTISGNEITIVCDKTVTQAVGEAICSLRIWDKSYKQKSTYQIILRVKSVSSYDENHEVSYSTISVLERLDEAICRAIDLKIELNETITLAEETDEKLKQTIAEANKSREDLQITINNSNNINNQLKETIKKAEDTDDKLNTSITNANNINTTLDNKITLANNTKKDLEDTITESVSKKNELHGEIIIADEKIEELKKFDVDGIVQKTNELYNETFPKNDLITIKHNLNCYPLVQFITTSDGYGKGRYGETIYGGSFACNLGNYETVYIDRNKLKIIVSDNYNLPDPILNKVNDYEYSITSDTTENSINIKLIDNETFDKISDMRYEDAQGTNVNIELNLQEPLEHGYFKKFIGKEDSNGNAITINGKYPLYKPCTTNPPNIKKDRPYEIYYNSVSNCFFLKASATGTVSANHVLAGETYSTENDTDLIGTMLNKKGSSIGSPESNAFIISKDICKGVATNAYVGAFDLNLPTGYYGEGLTNRIHIPNLLPKNFLKGVKVGWEDNYIEGSIESKGVYTDAISQGVDNNYLYTRIPVGAYLTKVNGTGYPEIKSKLSDVSSALKRLPDNKRNEVIGDLGGTNFLTGTKTGIDNDGSYAFYKITNHKGLVTDVSYLEIECSFIPKYIIIIPTPAHDSRHVRAMGLYRNDGEYFYSSTKCDYIVSGRIYTNGSSQTSSSGEAYSMAQSTGFKNGNIYRIPAPTTSCLYVVIG